MFCLSLLYIQFLYLEALLRLRHALLPHGRTDRRHGSQCRTLDTCEGPVKYSFRVLDARLTISVIRITPLSSADTAVLKSSDIFMKRASTMKRVQASVAGHDGSRRLMCLGRSFLAKASSLCCSTTCAYVPPVHYAWTDCHGKVVIHNTLLVNLVFSSKRLTVFENTRGLLFSLVLNPS